MNKISIVLLFLFCSFVFANNDTNANNPYFGVSATDESGDYLQNIKDAYQASGKLVLSYQISKEEVFENEVFYIDITANSNEKTSFTLHGKFDKNNDLEFLNNKITWKKLGNKYVSRLYFKAKNQNAKINSIQIDMLRNNEKILSDSVLIKKIRIKKLPFSKNFANIVGQNIEIKNVKSSLFDDKNIILSMDIFGDFVDFKDFKANNSNIIRQSVVVNSSSYEKSNATIFLTLPKDEKKFGFSYFDINEEKIKEINTTIEISSDEVSTQSDLNPTQNDMSVYWQIGFLVLAVSCFVLFVFFKTKYLLIVFGIIFVALSFTYQKFYKDATLISGSICTILPTPNSTIFFKTDKDYEVKILARYGEYSKILLDDKIGWVKNENIR